MPLPPSNNLFNIMMVGWSLCRGIDVCLSLPAGCELSFPHMRQSIRHAPQSVDCNCGWSKLSPDRVNGTDESTASLIRRMVYPEYLYFILPCLQLVHT